MEGLGYSKNQEPFLRLARSATLKRIKDFGLEDGGTRLEALLFGVAGLLPKINTLKEKISRNYVRHLLLEWKALRPFYRSELLFAADWQFFPTRPSNFPTLRLAAASDLIHRLLTQDLFHTIIQALKSNLNSSFKRHTLLNVLNVDTNDYWKYHYNFDRSTSKIIIALGSLRISEIIINTLLPIALLYARIFKDKFVREGTLNLYQSFPALENNSVVRFMINQLLKNRLPVNNVSMQQALIQLYKYYCIEKKCKDCEISAFMTI